MSSLRREAQPEQRLRLRNLRHFRGRRKAFERGREDGLRVVPAAGRLVKLGERERGQQRIAARALPVGDGDGGLKASSAGTRAAGERISKNSPRSR